MKRTWKEWLDENGDVIGVGLMFISGLGFLYVIFSWMCSL